MFSGALSIGTLARRTPPALVKCGGGHDANDGNAIDRESNQGSPNRHSSQEVSSAVDRVDDPLAMGTVLAILMAGGTELFTQDRIARSRGREPLTNRVFDFAVRFGDGSLIGLCGDGEILGLVASH